MNSAVLIQAKFDDPTTVLLRAPVDAHLSRSVLAAGPDLEDAPVPSTDGVLALVARPTAAHLPLLEELSMSGDWQRRSLDLLLRVAGAEAPYAPQLRHATFVGRQPFGIRLGQVLAWLAHA